MNASTLIVLLIIIVIAAFALKSSIGHFKGEGGCCGGGGTILPDEKELAGPKIGEKTVHIEGMHCENCKNRVERAINRIDGAVGKVRLFLLKEKYRMKRSEKPLKSRITRFSLLNERI